jgi:hypothetical protein
MRHIPTQLLPRFTNVPFWNRLLGTGPLFVPAFDGVAVGRILSIGLDGNDAVWLELLVLNTFASEENSMGLDPKSRHTCALNSECHRISVCDFVAFWISAHGLWTYFATSTLPLGGSSGYAIMALTCFGLRHTAFRFPGRGFGQHRVVL